MTAYFDEKQMDEIEVEWQNIEHEMEEMEYDPTGVLVLRHYNEDGTVTIIEVEGKE